MPEYSTQLRRLLFVGVLVTVTILNGCASTASIAKKDDHVSAQAVISTVKKAQLSQQAGKTGEALFYYEEVLKQDPGNRSALLGSARIFAELGKPELAEEYCDRVLRSSPDDAEALEGRGLSRFQQHKYQAAEDDLQQGAEIDQYRWRTWNALGVITDLKGKHAVAQGYYRRALGFIPDYPPLLNNLGYSMMMAHQYSQAEKIFRAGLSHAPQNPWLRNNMGISLSWLGRYQEAVGILSAGMKEAEAYNNVGYIALLKQDYPSAINYFKKALEISPVYYQRAAINLQRAQQQLHHRGSLQE